MEQLDLIYILKSGSLWRNNELRYSLRSVQKYLLEYGKIFIIGVCPRWVDTSNITFIPAEDPYSSKLRNAVHKIRIACLSPKVSEDFVLMNDDFFFLKKALEIPNYNRGTMSQHKKKHSSKKGYYYGAICDTYKMLKDMGVKTPVDFEVHYPMVINKKKFLKITDNIETKDGYLFRSVYGNLAGIKSMYRLDPKVYSADEICRMNQLDFLSTDNRTVLDKKFQRWIKRRLPTESRYEKTIKGAYYATVQMTYDKKTYNPGDIIREDLPERIVRAHNLKKVGER